MLFQYFPIFMSCLVNLLFIPEIKLIKYKINRNKNSFCFNKLYFLSVTSLDVFLGFTIFFLDNKLGLFYVKS